MSHAPEGTTANPTAGPGTGTHDAGTPDARLSREEHAKLLVELWKQTITVQQHFNDLSWRIRGMALTALTFTLGAAAVAAQTAVAVRLLGFAVQLSSLVTLAGLILWVSFFYVDRFWYYPLLKGSVKHGEALEHALRPDLPEAGLTQKISEVSPYKSLFRRKPVHSGKKLLRFYLTVGIVLIGFMIALQVGASPAKAPVTSQTTQTPSAATTGAPSGRPASSDTVSPTPTL